MAVFFAEDFTSEAARRRQVTAGRIAEVTRGVWTDETTVTAEEVVARHWRTIIGHLMPQAVITDRSGFTLQPHDGELFVSHPRSRPLNLPGLMVHPDGRQDNRRDDDIPLGPGLYGATPARALIDNAETRGRPTAVRRRLTRDELHDQVAMMVATYAPAQIDNIMATVDRDANRTASEHVRTFIKAARGETHLRTGSRAMSAAQRGEAYDGSAGCGGITKRGTPCVKGPHCPHRARGEH